jgi:MoaA/NifB/PqqE/SkfB family radical SAM enzyme
VKKSDVVRAWGRILTGYSPSLSIEITRECPLRCPGCYAYEPAHLGAAGPLRSLADSKGAALVDGVLRLVEQHRPLHVSLVGGEPLVRYRELDVLLPRLSELGIEVHLVTSAVRAIPAAWAEIKGLILIVSIDGLQPEHDARRKPATYERILANIAGTHITVHCTITRQMLGRADYLAEFMAFWSARPEVRKVWFSLFTPQVGARDVEILTAEERAAVIEELISLRARFPKLKLPDAVVAGLRRPPQTPAECIFARTTMSVTADLQHRITPCQFGGTPDCSQCGCMASAGLSAVGNYQLLGFIPVKHLYNASDSIGKVAARLRGAHQET